VIRVAVVGGGISGLALAEALRRHGLGAGELRVLERGDRAGGHIRTEVIDGHRCEHGPNGFLDAAPRTLALVRRLGLESRLQPADPAARRRFIYRRGRLHEVPGSPVAFLRSPLLSWRGRGRVLLEPFAAARPAHDETVREFASRRLGSEAADVLIDAMVSGVFAGEASRLSLRACFPSMWEMETRHGGLFRALLARRREAGRGAGGPAGPAGHLTSFRGGMADVVDALARSLGSSLCLSQLAVAVHRPPNVPGFSIEIGGGAGLEAETVVLAGPAAASASLVRRLDPPLAGELDGIVTAPLTVVCLGFDASWRTIADGRPGFGFLVPRGQGLRVLGALWDSSIYAGRAPDGRTLVRVMIGGAGDPRAIELPDQELVALAIADLESAVGPRSGPLFTRVVRHRRGIPQYTAGHPARLVRIERRLRQHPGLFLAGSSYRGVSLNACLADADDVAARVMDYLGAVQRREPAGAELRSAV
jgi:protoporphyrinogen/coproporphyrinogen III oxidase